MRTPAAAAGVLAVLACMFSGYVRSAEPKPRSVPVPRSELLTIHSRKLARTYDVHVKLPRSYASPERREHRYPVLYINDAPYQFQVAAGVTHLPMNAGAIEEMILVGIDYSHGSRNDDSRIRDYTPSVNPGFKPQTGGAAPYLDFLEFEVLPLIESKYRADPTRRGYAGHSLGGLFGAFVLFTRPTVFRYYILSSPSFWYDSHVTWRLEEQYAAVHDDLAAQVYVAIGELEHPRRPRGSPYEMVEDVLAFERRLHTHRYPSLTLRARVVEGATHETVFPTVLLNGVLWHFATHHEIPYGY